MVGRVPVPAQEVRGLKAILVGLCALLVVAQAAAAAKSAGHTTRPGVRARRQPARLEGRLHRQLAIERRARRTVRFFEKHPALLRSRAQRVVARTTLVHAERRLSRARKEVSHLRRTMRAREIRRLRRASPRTAICGVFRGDCRAAVDVAWCESRLQTTARNGQYLGLFQLGTMARERFGHGPTAWEQATAAHRYYVYSGSNWGPWSCKPSHAYS